MPRPGPRRVFVGVRLSPAGLAWITERALAEAVTKGDGTANRSEFLRRVLAYAQLTMPPGWQP